MVIIIMCIQVALEAITIKPAYSPAEAFVNSEAIKPCIGDKPIDEAKTPNEKATAKYPIPIGKPSLRPCLK